MRISELSSLDFGKRCGKKDQRGISVDLAVAFTIVVSILGSSTVTYLASSRTISGVAQGSKRTIREITNDFLHKFIAGDLQRVAFRENRKLDSSDLSNGLDFANKALRKFEGGE